MWCEAGSLKAREKISYNAKQQSKSGCFLREVVDWIRRKKWIYLNWRNSEVPVGIVACDVCMKAKGYFCKVVAEWIFSLETLKTSTLLILFSFFEVKILPDSALKFCVVFFAISFCVSSCFKVFCILFNKLSLKNSLVVTNGK